MKPYGRIKNTKFPSKTDGHYKEKNRKIGNWWESQENIVPRVTVKQIVIKEIQEDMEVNEN